MLRALIVTGLLMTAVTIAFVMNKKAQNKHSITADQKSLGSIEKFDLIDQHSQSFSNTDMYGKVWIVNFFFTRCGGPCPILSQKMSEIQEKLQGFPKIELASISMDPVYDTPERMKEYGTKFHNQYEKWKLLTGERAQIIEIARKMFQVPAGEDPNMHSVKFMLIDERGYVRSHYDSEDKKSMLQLLQDAKSLANQQQVSH